MLHTKLRGNRSAGSGEENIETFFNLKLTRMVRSRFVGQSAIHGQLFELFKASVTNFPIQKVVCNS